MPALETLLVHAGEPHPRIAGAVSLPIFQSSTFESAAPGGDYHQLRYIRLNNTPGHDALHKKLAALEGGEEALVTASGMAAIATTLLTVLRPGDHLLAQRCLYGGTHDLLTGILARLGVTHSFIDAGDPASWEAAVRPETRAIYIEALSNPLLEVACVPEVAAFARARGLTSIIDSTFAPPVLLRPLAHGVDLVLHSATKYLNGHSDIVAGAVIGDGERVAAIRRTLNHLGGCLDPHACFLLHRGLKTLSVRVRQQSATALSVAQALADHPEVAAVHYPGLEGDPGHARARALLTGGFGGMMSFTLRGDTARVDRFLAALTLPIVAPSLGGPETLVTIPARTSHVGTDPEVRRSLGIADGLVRLSIGLEDAGDLIADLRAALGA